MLKINSLHYYEGFFEGTNFLLRPYSRDYFNLPVTVF